jgi:alpha-amylase
MTTRENTMIRTRPLSQAVFLTMAGALFLMACQPDALDGYSDENQGQLTSLEELVLDDDVRLTNHVDDWRDEIIYQLFTDRFADGDISNNWNVNKNAPAQYHGGDWQGIIDNIWYLKELGITAIWISPVVTNVENDAGFAGYHGYWTQNFLKPNPHFGDLAKLKEMVEVCHENDIKVIMDIVTNHIGQLFFYDINGNGWPDEATYGCGNSNECDSKVQHVIEYDPDYDSRGVQGVTSLGESGPAPIIWIHDPEWNHMPILPKEFQNPDWYNKRGRVYIWKDWIGDAPSFDFRREQEVKGDFPGGLKDIDTSHPDATAALIKVFQYWIRTTDIDGYRIDTLKHVEHSFWEEFCPAMRNYARAHGKDNFFQFGEAFDGDDWLIGSYTYLTEERRDDQGRLVDAPDSYKKIDCSTENADRPVSCDDSPWIDSVFYFSQKFSIYDRIFKEGFETQGAEALYNDRAKHYGELPTVGINLPPQQVLVNFMSNHDIPRFLYDKPSVDALQNAFSFLLTQDGIPCVYYGEEQEFTGGNDPKNREDMVFDVNNPTFKVVQRLIEIRKQYDALRRGDYAIRWVSNHSNPAAPTATENDSGILAFERSCKTSVWSEKCDGPNVLVVINVHDHKASSTVAGDAAMPVDFAPGTVLSDVWTNGAEGFTVSADGTVTVEVPPRGFRILVPTGG